jgi:hypothetical protein
MRKINFDQGTISFRIPEGAIDYKDNKFVYLVNYVSSKGFLKIVKDKDNGLKVLYNYRNNGNCQLNSPAQDLDNNDSHTVVVTWSMENREVILYIDGIERAKCEINISS